MKVWRTTALLLLLVAETLTQGFDLSDALDDLPQPTPAKPKESPKTPEKTKTDGGGGGLDLLDAFDPDPKHDKPTVAPPKGGGGGGQGGGGELDLLDAFGPDPTPAKGGGGQGGGGGAGGGGRSGKNFDDSDLFDIGGHKPDGGNSGRGGAADPGYNREGGAEEPQEAGSGKIAGIVSAVGVALLGAASSYIAYQKKKLCFKLQGGADPESGKAQYGQQSDPQVFSNLLRTS